MTSPQIKRGTCKSKHQTMPLSQSTDYLPQAITPFLPGVYLAVNAIKDIHLLVDGPSCAHAKTEWVQGGHDWMSTLTSVSGFQRVSNTDAHIAKMARSRESEIEESLHRIASRETVVSLLLTAMPMASITGVDYGRICERVAAQSGKCVVHVPSKSLSGDWLDGYAEGLLALAKSIPLPSVRCSEPTNVAIVGYLYDRNEQDHGANVGHLTDLLRSSGLQCVSIWLGGQSFDQLQNIASAGTILSFPYGRKAAKVLADRTESRLIECELPFGFDATERWLRHLGAELGVEAQANDTIDQQLAIAVPRLEWVIPFHFQGRKIAYVGDPHMAVGMKEIAAMLGAHLHAAAITNLPHHCVGVAEHLNEVELLGSPKWLSLMKFLHSAVCEGQVSLLVCNGYGVGLTEVPWLEIGYPCMYRHALYDSPFLGFQGLLSFVNMLTNALRMHEIFETSKRLR